eukprot:6998493-Alexandrium_andersonii.AAC.1
MQKEPTNNLKILDRAGIPPVSAQLRSFRIAVLGHVLQRPQSSPVKNMAFDRLLKPMQASGVRRPGLPRPSRAAETMQLAVQHATQFEPFEQFRAPLANKPFAWA